MSNLILGGDEERDPVAVSSPPMKERKVVVRLLSGEVVKGHFILPSDYNVADLFNNSNQNQSTAITINEFTSNEPVQVELSDVKAVFLVKSFRGDLERKNLRFYTNGPSVGAIWAEIRFQDNEIIEVMIDNSSQHLMGDGFLVRPSDAGGNNLLAYVNKSAIANYRVLGVRAHFGPEE